jgi:hypothetical protein
MTSSAFWFYGRLTPAAATRFNVQEFQIDRGVRLEVFHDGIALWLPRINLEPAAGAAPPTTLPTKCRPASKISSNDSSTRCSAGLPAG